MKSPAFPRFAACVLSSALGFASAGNALAARTETLLASGWRFHKGDQSDAKVVHFADQSWATIQVPHSWDSGEEAVRNGAAIGVGWYRLSLRFNRDQVKKRLFIWFGAASREARVYFNGQLIGDHQGAFGAFCIPIGTHAQIGANELAVRVDSTTHPDVPPLSGDFTTYGGLYREVKLIAQNEVGISPLDYGSSGVFLKPTMVGQNAEIAVDTDLLSESSQASEVTVRTTIEDAKGARVASDDTKASIPANGKTVATNHLHFANPHLWDGVRAPYLYRARVQVSIDGRLLDEVVQPLGIRTYRVDPEQGLFLNGTHYDLHGVNLHQGQLDSAGWTESLDKVKGDYEMIREMGCTGVRMAHYQHSSHEFDQCDRLGLGVWAELCVVNRVSDSPAFRENAAQQLQELIKQNYNHPSFMFVSLYNEPGIDKKQGDGPWHQMEDLVKLSHSLHPNRPVTGAMAWGHNFWLSWVGDLASFNHYYGWYEPGADTWGARLDAARKEAQGRSFGISEYGAGASLNMHEWPAKQPIPTAKWHPEEWQAVLHENVWPALEARPWIWCKLLWVMFDFKSDGRNEGDRPHINDKGLVAGDHKTRKDAFYYYKANWTTAPLVYLTSRRFYIRPTGETEIKVYSTCETVRLKLNGRALGEMHQRQPHVFVLTASLVEGENSVEAIGTNHGKLAATDACQWQGRRGISN